jgi:hypothetical protein
MRNIIYLVIAAVFFALAYYVYWVATDGAAAPQARGIGPMAAPPASVNTFIQQWQPVLSLVSSLGGIISLLFQLRVWMRSRRR